MFNHQLWRRLIMVAAGLLLGSLVLGGFLIANSTATHAAPRAVTHANGGQCSNATLNGTYVFDEPGYQIQGSNRSQLAETGYSVYDGNGHVGGIFSQSVNGQITRFIPITGTYTVHPNCTATETDTIPGSTLHFDDFITHDGNVVGQIETDPGVVLSGFESRGTGQ